ncbi:MAG: hypothetical protein KF708_09890 [Pirellulales bacterium]|nr:hypothetical protein [Pirellulales bacterium]
MMMVTRSARSRLKWQGIPGGSLALAAIVLCGAAPRALQAEEPAKKVTYADDVKPILREHCFSCHNMSNAKSDLALDDYGRLMAGGASGEVVLAGDLDSSRLWMLVSHQEEPKMPPEQDKLPEAKLAVIKTWIEGGALENSGSVAKPKKPKANLMQSAGAARPEGPAIMPENISKQPLVYTPRTTAVASIAASPWAPVVAVSGQKQVPLYHSDSGELLGVLPFAEGTPEVLRFSRSGALLLAGGGRGGHSGRVVVFDVKSGERVFELGDELDTVLAADINEDHTRVALGGPQRVVRIFDTEDGTQLHEIRKHTEWVYAIEYSPDGVLLATADRNGELIVWEAETAREYQNLKGHTAAVNAVSWRLDSNLLASASEDGSVRLWEMENGTQVKTWNAHAGGVASIHFTHDGRLVTAGRDRQVKVWDLEGKQLVAFEALPDLALAATFTHDGARVVGGDWTGALKLWNVADGVQVAALATNPPTLEMAALAAADAAAAAKVEAEKIATELAAAEQELAARTTEAQAAAAALAPVQAAADAAAAELAASQSSATAANDTLAALRTALEKAEAAKAVADKLAAEKAEREKVAAAALAEAKTIADAVVAAQIAAQQKATERRTAADAATAKATATQAAAEKAAAEKAAFEAANPPATAGN